MIHLTDIEAAGYPVLRPAWLGAPALGSRSERAELAPLPPIAQAPPLPDALGASAGMPRTLHPAPQPGRWLPEDTTPSAYRAVTTPMPVGGVWTTAYDPDRNLIAIVDPLGVRTTLSRDQGNQ